jgi:prevent-host-death family protein
VPHLTLYIDHMNRKTIAFSQARQNLSTLIDEVEEFGRSVTIVRNGRPAAVIIDPGTYRELIENKPGKCTLKGSITAPSVKDLDQALSNAKRERIRLRKNIKESQTQGSL